MIRLNSKACAIFLILMLSSGLAGCTQPSSSQTSQSEVTTTIETFPTSPATTASELPTETSTSNSTQHPSPFTFNLSPEEAADLARDRVGSDARVLSVEADFEDNPPVYEIELDDGTYRYELEIHAITGAILDYEKERYENESDDD